MNNLNENQIKQDLFNFFIKQVCQNCIHSLYCLENTTTGQFSIFCNNCTLFSILFSPGWSVKIQKEKSFIIRFSFSSYMNISVCGVFDDNFKIIEFIEFPTCEDFLKAIYDFETIYKKYSKLSVLL